MRAPASHARSPRLAWAGRASVLLALLPCWVGCKSDEQRCEEARVAAEIGWQTQIDSLERALAASISAQAEATSRLVGEIEPRLSAAAELAAAQRYDRHTDAFQRAFRASMNSACEADQDCAQLKRENAQAKEQQADIGQTLPTYRAALAALRESPARMKQAASEVIPDVNDAALQAARKASDLAFAACKDIEAGPTPPSP